MKLNITEAKREEIRAERFKRKIRESYMGERDDYRAFLEAYKSCQYRKAESRWAGGEHKIKIQIFSIFLRHRASAEVHSESSTAWSKNRKWRGTNSRHEFWIQRSWRLRVARRGLGVVDGMLTLDVERPSEEECLKLKGDEGLWRAWWVVQGRGTSLRREQGYLFRLSDELPWVHGKSISSCRAVARRRFRAELEERARHAALHDEQARTLITQHDGEWTATYQDSREVGNCATGTRSWIERWCPGRKELRGHELRHLAEKSGSAQAWAVYWRAGHRWLAARWEEERRPEHLDPAA